MSTGKKLSQTPLVHETAEGAGGLLRNSFQLRDEEQLLVKFSYRFEN